MNTSNITKQNIARVKRRIEAEINRSGRDITFYRPKYESDGMNGKTKTGDEPIGTQKGVVINLSGNQVQEIVTDGGRTYKITSNCLLLYGELQFKAFDWFEDDNCTYEVINATNVDLQDVYWLLQLYVIRKEVAKYG